MPSRSPIASHFEERLSVKGENFTIVKFIRGQQKMIVFFTSSS